jgi:uridine kinase
VTPRRIIILDGILIFAEPQLLSLMDMKIFVDTEDDLRLIRRIKRDITERQRSIESVITQYTRTVRPMHLLYVEPSKRCADIIVPAGQGIQPVALDMCVSRLREIISVQE